MNMMTLAPPVTEAPTLARTSQRVRDRVAELALAMGTRVDAEARQTHPLMRGCFVLSSAGVVLSGTACARPMWQSQCLSIAQDTGFDFGLLRFDPIEGVTLDWLPPDGADPLIGYHVWRTPAKGLWFIPSAGDGPFVRAGDWGIKREKTPPFTTAAQRSAGIITAINHPSFAGSF